ncbi:hypothetical protein IAU60_001571 [Kwoniella sp. DSM 27419]
MSALDDLFNSPPRPAPPRSPIPTSPSSPIGAPAFGTNPLFFSPGPSEFGSSSRSARQRTHADARRSRSASPSLQAGASGYARAGTSGEGAYDPRAVATAPDVEERTYATHELGVLDFDDPFAGLRVAAEDDEGQGARKKRVMAKVDADRLTSDRGIPALCRAAKKFRVRGKGSETKDLRTLLNVYQMWAHGMFPKGDFAHTINRVEVICRSRRMESAIAGYRDAFYPRARTPSPAPDHEGPAGDDAVDRALTPPSADEQSHGPLFTARPDDDLDPDVEEMMALEEMERDAAAGMNGGGPRAAANGADEPPHVREDDEWEGLYD